MPQKYTSSQHGNKCLKEEIRSVTKVGFVSKDKASLVRKDTTGHVKKISLGCNKSATLLDSFSHRVGKDGKRRQLLRTCVFLRHPYISRVSSLSGACANSYLLCTQIACACHGSPNSGCCQSSSARLTHCSPCPRLLLVPLSCSPLSPDSR